MRLLETRAFLCHEELRLNRRFTPELYLEVCAITATDGAPRFWGRGKIIEYAVRMRQFDRGTELDRLLTAGSVSVDDMETFGRTLADIHARLPAVDEARPWGRPAQVRALIIGNLSECASYGMFTDAEAGLHALQATLARRLQDAQEWLATRRAAGRVRECHGDLHCRNIMRLGATLRAFDCVEFEPAFRWIDVADEIALLLADLEARGHPEQAHAFLHGYLSRGGDYHACRLLDLYKAHRALVRAKVAALTAAAATDSELQTSQRAEQLRLIDCAKRALRPRVPQLLLMCGFAGSGKTWLAQRLMLPLRAVWLRSDVERKRSAGLDALAHSDSGIAQDLYSPRVSEVLYEYLARCARDILCGGYNTIVDASFARHADRALFRSLAAQVGVCVRIVHCHAPLPVLRERVAQRHRAGTDESEAAIGVLDWQLTQFEPIRADEQIPVIDLDTRDLHSVNELVGQCMPPACAAAAP
jgi:aminoglycoside phosphotransferase family enzyme/predicted kinase